MHLEKNHAGTRTEFKNRQTNRPREGNKAAALPGGRQPPGAAPSSPAAPGGAAAGTSPERGHPTRAAAQPSAPGPHRPHRPARPFPSQSSLSPGPGRLPSAVGSGPAPLVPGSNSSSSGGGGRSAGARPRHIATPGLLPARLAGPLPPGPEALRPSLLGTCSPARPPSARCSPRLRDVRTTIPSSPRGRALIGAYPVTLCYNHCCYWLGPASSRVQSDDGRPPPRATLRRAAPLEKGKAATNES